jgi:hypothetical protein
MNESTKKRKLNDFEFQTTSSSKSSSSHSTNSNNESNKTNSSNTKPLFGQKPILQNLNRTEIQGKSKHSMLHTTIPTLTRLNPTCTIFSGKIPKSFLVFFCALLFVFLIFLFLFCFTFLH